MEIKPVTQATSPIKRLLTNPKAAQFAQSTICAISVETTLKALGRPTFIYLKMQMEDQKNMQQLKNYYINHFA